MSLVYLFFAFTMGAVVREETMFCLFLLSARSE